LIPAWCLAALVSRRLNAVRQANALTLPEPDAGIAAPVPDNCIAADDHPESVEPTLHQFGGVWRVASSANAQNARCSSNSGGRLRENIRVLSDIAHMNQTEHRARYPTTTPVLAVSKRLRYP
jgi:hypothetical protein